MANRGHTETGRGATYRAAGWWTDQPLIHRYRSVVADRLHRLGCADDRGVELTHGQLLAMARDDAHRLGESGVRAGDIVLMSMPNRAEWQVVFQALCILGAVPMTVPTTTDPDTLVYLSRLTGADTVIVANSAGRTGVADDVIDAFTVARLGARVIKVASSGGMRVSVVDGTDRDVVARHPELDHVMTTSSTTGKPKAVMHTANTLAALNALFAERFSLTSDTPLFFASPLGHSVGAIHGARLAMYTGAPLILQEKWDPERAIAMVERYGCRFTAAATPFLKDLLDAPTPADAPKLASMRTFLCGGAAVAPSMVDAAEREFPKTVLSVLWGMTEGGVTTCLPETPADKRRASAGCGLPGLELSTIDDQGRHLARGEEGELVMRGPGVFVGYLGQEDLYEESLTDDGFFRTGDQAQVDDDNYIFLTGRLKDLIIRGGVNISPLPIEDALSAHPCVRRVAVVGLPDERLGERLCAVIVPAEGATMTLDDLTAFAEKEGLPRRLWPEHLEIVDEMPQTAAGKIRKNELRERLFGGGTP